MTTDPSHSSSGESPDTAQDSPLPATTRVRSVRAGLSVGVVAAGTACLAAGAWVLGSDFARPDPRPGGSQVLVVFTWLGLLALVVARLVATRRTPRTPAPGDTRPTWLPAAVRTALGLVVVLLALGAAVYGFLGLRSQFELGFPGRRTVLVLVGGVATALGLLIGTGRPRVGGWRPSLPGGVAAVAGVGLVAALALPLTITADGWRVHHTTVTASTATGAPASVSKIAWSSHVDGKVIDAAAAGPGVVVLTTSGAFAFDGKSGASRWSYRRTGATFVQVGSTPRHDIVLIGFSPGRYGSERVLGMDAATGRIRFTLHSEGSDAGFGPSDFQLTNTSILSGLGDEYSDDDLGFQARSLSTGDVLWDFRAPAGCELVTGRRNAETVPDGLVVLLRCGDLEAAATGAGKPTQLRTELLDGTDGHVRWRRTDRLSAAYQRLDALSSASPDGRYVSYSFSHTGFIDDNRGFVLDSSTGEEQTIGRNVTFRDGDTYVGPNGSLRDVSTDATVLRNGDSASCVIGPDGLLLTRATVCASFPYVKDNSPAIASVRVGSLPDDRATSTFRVPLGGPYTSDGRLDSSLKLVAAPGALVLVDTAPLLDSGRATVVGMR